MNRALALFCIGIFLGGGIGFVAAAANGVTLDGHDHASHGQHTTAEQTSAASQLSGHDHGEPIDLPAGAETPELELSVQADPMSGWNLHITTKGFKFAPENASRSHVAGEGHAHVYVNGKKIARLYGNWLHISKLPKGRNTIEVTLNSNDHRPLAVGSVALRKSAIVTAD